MVKRILCMLLLALLLPCAALANEMVIDDAKLFSSYEISDMEQIIQRIEAEYQMDILVLTTYDVPQTYSDYAIQDYADNYFDQHGYGLGEDSAGLLYMIDMTNRAPCISTSGVMIDYITDDRLDTLFNASYDDLCNGNYGKATIVLLNTLESQMEQGIPDGSFRYNAETGMILNESSKSISNVMLEAALTSVYVFILMCIGGAVIW
ncbi:MAG: TPM domain-containing protein [Clostridia bacterium]|nr:TPM domain-containing protein [Clostridia bacterium]